MSDYTKLLVWKKAHALTLAIYRQTADWPRHEQYGLTSQARRAASSIPCNLAEGSGRDSDAELARYVSIAKGSAAELSYLILLATDLGYRPDSKSDETTRAIVEVQRMLWSLERKLREPRARNPAGSRQRAND